MKFLSFSILCLLLMLAACRKESFITSPDAQVRITADTLKYDTVFTNSGSVTQSFKIINENNRKLRLSSVQLMGGNASNYKMNVDGVPTTQATGIEIDANDSVYVFVQVNVDPAVAALPFVIRDSIQVSFNGNDRLVQLEAWGQNAHFLRDAEIATNTTWTNDLPYVILGYLYVAPGIKLTIDKGCRIYVHAGAPILVDGTLEVNGGVDTADRVIFNGDRLDAPYKDYPASWPGIYFTASSQDNSMNYAMIKNAYQGLIVQSPAPNANPKLTLTQCVIDNAYDAGILGINTSITATNCLISNCGKNVQLTAGGSYLFTHCTVVSYSNTYVNHKDPVLQVANHDGSNTAFSLDAVFRNCIFWGENGLVEEEVLVSKTGATPFTVNFDHVLWKVTNVPANVNPAPTNAINQPPAFDSIDVGKRYYNFRLKADSPAVDAGTNAGVTIDLGGQPRPNGIPDLGCFEKQ